MSELSEILNGTTIEGRIKCDKTQSDQVLNKLREIDGISADQITTDEFDIPPTAIIRVIADLEEINDG